MTTQERLKELLDYNPETGIFTWKVHRDRVGTAAGAPNACGYLLIQVDQKPYYAHRLAFLAMTGRWPENEVDHINGQPGDNRWVNIRLATRSENTRNVGKSRRNTSGAPGVYRDAAKSKWRAHIRVNRKQIHLGYFTEFSGAVAARRAAETKYHGEFSATASRL